MPNSVPAVPHKLSSVCTIVVTAVRWKVRTIACSARALECVVSVVFILGWARPIPKTKLRYSAGCVSQHPSRERKHQSTRRLQQRVRPAAVYPGNSTCTLCWSIVVSRSRWGNGRRPLFRGLNTTCKTRDVNFVRPWLHRRRAEPSTQR